MSMDRVKEYEEEIARLKQRLEKLKKGKYMKKMTYYHYK